MGLGLQADADVFDRAGDDTVGEAGKGAGGVVLGVGEDWVEGGGDGVAGFEVAPGGVEAGELDRYLGTAMRFGGEGDGRRRCWKGLEGAAGEKE